MNETQLRGWMRALPRAKASPGFNSEVLRKVRSGAAAQARRPSLPFAWRMTAAFAMAACVFFVVQLAMLQQGQRQRDALRAEGRQLAAELAAVKEIAREAEPVVVLENDEGTRVIVDLDSAVQPASLRSFD